jgi:hypothetical protein
MDHTDDANGKEKGCWRYCPQELDHHDPKLHGSEASHRRWRILDLALTSNDQVWRSCRWCGDLFVAKLSGSDACEKNACSAKSRRVEISPQTGNNLSVISMPSWRIFEDDAAIRMRVDYPDAQVTPKGTQAIDIRASGAVAQCKDRKAPVYLAEVQRLVGAALGLEPWFFSREGYTRRAREWAAVTDLRLFMARPGGWKELEK